MSRHAYSNGTIARVGTFFEQLGQTIFGGEQQNDGTCDLACWDIECGVEIKASDSNHSWRLALDQLDHYEELTSGFPFNHFVYALFGYENKRERRRRGPYHTALSRQRTARDIEQFLLENADTLWILDLNALLALREALPISENSIPCQPGQKTINVNRTLLAKFRNNLPDGLQALSATITAPFNPTLFDQSRAITLAATFIQAADTPYDLVDYLQQRDIHIDNIVLS